jgi:alpha-L-rhamnosidase
MAYTLLLNENFPSWLYEVNMGATTVWERWNSVLPNGKISGISMNSMNHYAYGAVMECVYRNVLGINPVEEEPGFKKIRLAPQPDARLGAASACFDSPCGTYKSAWKTTETGFAYDFTIPFGCTAELELPCGHKQTLTAGTYHFE